MARIKRPRPIVVLSWRTRITFSQSIVGALLPASMNVTLETCGCGCRNPSRMRMCRRLGWQRRGRRGNRLPIDQKRDSIGAFYLPASEGSESLSCVEVLNVHSQILWHLRATPSFLSGHSFDGFSGASSITIDSLNFLHRRPRTLHELPEAVPNVAEISGS